MEGHYEPIVPREVFWQVQGERMRRSALRDTPRELRFGSMVALEGRLICAKCVRALKRCALQRNADEHSDRALWCCCDRAVALSAAEAYPYDDCSLLPLDEAEAKALILEAFNRLPLWQTRLEDMLARLQSSYLGPLNRRIACEDALLRQLEERLEAWMRKTGATTGRKGLPSSATQVSEEPEELALHRQVADARRRREALYARRAPYANREMQLRMLLELLDELRTPSSRDSVLERETPAACGSYEDFFDRTRYQPSRSLFDEHGHLEVFEDALVIRFLQSVKVHERYCEVALRPGLR